MKVSIVIPAHNEEAYIEQTIAAALAQQYPTFEVIVVDNASTDKTSEIVRRFQSQGVKLVHESRLGSQFARERGRIEATGEIIASLDADSIPDPLWLARTIPLFDDQNICAVSGSADYFDGLKLLKISSFIIQNTVFVATHFILQSIRTGAVMLAGNMFIRSRALSKIGGYDTSITFYGDDTDTARRLMASGGKILYKPRLTVRSSARRYARQGMLFTFYLYVINFLWVTFFKHPFSQRISKKKKVGAKV